MTSPWAVIIVVIYFVILGLVVGKWGKGKEKGLGEFAVAGRSAPWWLLMFTVLATWVIGSTYTATMGYAVMSGAIGIYMAIYTVIGLVIFYYIGPRIWVWGKVHNLYNLPDYIGRRYGDRRLAILVAIAGFAIGAPWQIMALKTFGYTTTALTYGALPEAAGMAIFATIIAVYCIYGGMRSVVVTDFFQGMVCVVVVIFGIIAAIYLKFGGIGPMFQQVLAQRPEMLVIEDTKYWTSIIVASALGAYCWLEIFNRIFLARSVRDLKIIARGAPILGGGIYFLVGILGVGGSILASVNADLGAAESGFLTIFSEVGGPILLAFAAIIIIAAEMSSIDSQLATGGVVLARNAVAEFKRGGLSEMQTVKLSRWIIGIWMVIVYFLSIGDLPALITFAIVTYEFLAAMFPTIIIGTLWKRGTAKACWASLAVGWIVCGILQIWPVTQGWFGGWGAGITGAFFAMIVYFAVSLASPKDEKVEALFAEVEAYKEVR